jgi:hypothetical protein
MAWCLVKHRDSFILPLPCGLYGRFTVTSRCCCNNIRNNWPISVTVPRYVMHVSCIAHFVPLNSVHLSEPFFQTYEIYICVCVCMYECMRHGYKVPGMILLQASYLYTYSLFRGVSFEVLPFSSYALSPTMLLLLETFWNLCCGTASSGVVTFFGGGGGSDVFNILNSSSV